MNNGIEGAGFEIVSNCLTGAEVDLFLSRLEAAQKKEGLQPKYGMRNLLRLEPVAELARLPKVFFHVQRVLDREAFPVRALFFDKTPEANWKVAWHQDLTIAVAARIEIPGFGPWSTKAGIVHVQPPTAILERMLSVRVHLDDCPADNGALRVIPGSHLRGRLDPQATAEYRKAHSAVTCDVPKGGLLLMRPLLLHASSKSRIPVRRRVIHIEYAADPLPAGLQWHETDVDVRCSLT